MNGSSNKLVGFQIKFALIVGLLVSLSWTHPVNEEKTALSVKDKAVKTEELIDPVPVVEKDSVNGGQLRFPPFDNNGNGFFEKFGEKFRNKWNSPKTTTTTTTTTTTKAPEHKMYKFD
ncbi:hypothetical protein KR054_007240 [Drosophila jambulina]|nr:hypothetical protein KR054_007240 [Drosophila jambulina]